MEQGGNEKLKDYLSAYDLDQIVDSRIKYNTLAMDYYRRRNLALSQGMPMEQEAPDYATGR